MEITFNNTKRGFGKGNFQDAYGAECSIQDSSIMEKEPYLWLGLVDANPQIMRSDARKLGLPNSEGNGWMEYKFPNEVFLSTRMHLSKTQVKGLIKVLKKWVKEGILPED